MTAAEIRLHIETDLEDVPLGRLVAAAEEELEAGFGAKAVAVDVLEGVGRRYLFTSRPVSSVTSIVEREADVDTTLVATDYRKLANNRQLERLSTGTNARSSWAEGVTVTYVPDDQSRWESAEIELVRLAVEFNAKKSESVGDYSATSADYWSERARIIGSLSGVQFS